jgi:hypothetical protein
VRLTPLPETVPAEAVSEVFGMTGVTELPEMFSM